jgi:Tfp pilus assembly PilM family ATPase
MEKLIVIGFYREDQWPLLLKTADDSEVMEKVYAEWKKGIERLIANMRMVGIEPVIVDIDMYELLSYCRQHSLKNNGETRSQFVAELLSNRQSQNVESKLFESGRGI